jgi:hypothetical protein
MGEPHLENYCAKSDELPSSQEDMNNNNKCKSDSLGLHTRHLGLLLLHLGLVEVLFRLASEKAFVRFTPLLALVA